MTVREVLGLLGLNLLFVGVGLMLLWASGAWRSWSELGRFIGLAYFLGIGALVIVLTAGLAIGVSFGSTSLLASAGALAACAFVVGRFNGQSAPSTPISLRPPRLSVLSALWTAGLVVYLEVLYRASQLSPAGEWDAWWVWTIRAKALYYFGHLGGSELVNGSTSDYPSYPPGVSLVEAAAFEAMGEADAVTLHLQHWFLVLGFIAALLGLLISRVRASVLLPFVVLTVSTPVFVSWSTALQADLLLGFQVALGALLVLEWLERRHIWCLVCAALLLGSALLTKREAVYIVGCVLVAALVASYRDRRQAWPPVVGTGLAAVGLALPWWISAFGGAGPSDGFLGLVDHSGRIISSFRLVAGVSVDHDLALGAGLIVAAVVPIGYRAGKRLSASFLAVFAASSLVATTLVFASEPLFEFSRLPEESPVQRLVLVVLTCALPLTALVFGDFVEGIRARPALSSAHPVGNGVWPPIATWALTVVVALAYPLHLVVT